MFGEAEELAERMGVAIRTGAPPNGWWGYWDPDTRTITLNKGLAPLQGRSTLWHELGHAHHNHVGHTGRGERQAKIWAARHLITVETFIQAGQIDGRRQAMAAQLGVLERDVEAFTWSLTPAERVMVALSVDTGYPVDSVNAPGILCPGLFR